MRTYIPACLRYVCVQLLIDRVMVRVGGGWDTLDHFLLEHDPCRILRFSSGEFSLLHDQNDLFFMFLPPSAAGLVNHAVPHASGQRQS